MESDGEEGDFGGEGGGLAFGFCGFVVVEGFLGVPGFYVGAHCLSGWN